MISHRRKKTVRPRHDRIHSAIEQLEDRRMLTALAGGDTFRYQQEYDAGRNGVYVEIRLSGNIMAEIVGGVLDDQNNLVLTDLPGRFVASNTRANVDYLGGFGGKRGIAVAGNSNTSDPAFGAGNIGDEEDLNFDNLAGNSGGELWTINQAEVTIGQEDRQIVQVVQVDPLDGSGDVAAMIHNATLGQDVAAPLTGTTLQGPLGDVGIALLQTGLATFTAEFWAMTQEGWLYRVDRETGIGEEIAQITHLDNALPGTLTGLKAMAFDPVQPVDPITGLADPNQRTLWVLTRDYDGDPATDASGRPTGDQSTGDPPTTPTTTWDIALLRVDLVRDAVTGVWTAETDSDRTHQIRQDTPEQYEDIWDYTAMIFYTDPNTGETSLYASAQSTDQSGTGGGGPGGAPNPWELHRIDPLTPAGPFTLPDDGSFVLAQVIGEIAAGGAGGGGGGGGAGGATGPSRIDGMAMSVDVLTGAPIMIAIDNMSTDQGVRPRMLSINRGDPESSVALSVPGGISQAAGVASFQEPGDLRPTLYSILTGGGARVVRGTSAALGTVAGSGESTVESVRAADFNPIDGRLYFVVEQTITVGATDTEGPMLISIDAHARSRTAIQNSLQMVQGTFIYQNAIVEIDSIAFDQTSATTTTLYASGAGRVWRIPMVNTNGIAQTANPNDPIQFECTVTASGDITGLAFLGSDPRITAGDDPDIAETFIYALMNDGAESQLIRIRLGANTAMQWGSVTLPPEMKTGNGPWVGDNLQGLAWNPNLYSPYTNERGALMATDVSTDQLVIIDHRLRPENATIFEIHITQADADASIYFSEYEPHPDPRFPLYTPAPGGNHLRPFDGDVGQFRVINAQPDNPQYVLVDSNALSGDLLLGVLTKNIDCDDPDDDLRPVLPGVPGNEVRGPINGAFGMVPVGDGWIRAGMTVTTGGLANVTNFNGSMVGLNVDIVSAASVRFDNVNPGQVALLDRDRMDALGNPVLEEGDQLALGMINPITQTVVLDGAFGSIDIVDLLGNRLRNGTGLDWGDPDGDGIEELYAIFPINGVPTLGILGTDPLVDAGIFTPIGPVGSLASVATMAFSPTQQLYVADAGGGIHRIDPATGNYIATAANLPFTAGSMDFALTGRLYVHDVQFGRLVDVDVATGQVGSTVMTPADSLRPTIGAITYDAVRNRMVGFDNSLSREIIAPNFQGIPQEGASPESSMFVSLAGLTGDIPQPQNIGSFRFAGTVTGQIDISGSIEDFYAGWLPLGATGGQELSAAGPTVPQNFRAGGEIRDFLVLDSIGTHDASAYGDSTYVTGFDLVAGGKIQQIVSREDVMGSIRASNNGTVLPNTRNQQEMESRPGLGNFGDASYTVFWNDDSLRPQYLGTINGTAGNNVAQVRGTLLGPTPAHNDLVDRYSLSLMAGQTVVVQLIPLSITTFAHIGVFDPDGRLIATDYSDVDPEQYWYQKFTFTADRPGLFEFAVGGVGANADFAGAISSFGPYELRVTASADGGASAAGPGNIALGAIQAERNVFDGRSLGTAWRVDQGDFGAIVGRTRVASMTATTGAFETAILPTRELAIDSATLRVDFGSLRAIDGGSVGIFDPAPNGGYGLGVDVQVVNGSVGLIRSTGGGANDATVLNDDLLFYGTPAVSDHDISGLHPYAAVGFDYQMVSAESRFYGAMMANRAIGTVRARIHDLLNGGNLALTPTWFVANADKAGDDGIIGLISSEGDIGNNRSGGPAVITGPGGDLKYMYTGGVAWRDSYFGGGGPDTTITYPGEVARFNDDSGAIVNISPMGADVMTINTFPVRGSGGVAVVNVNSPGSMQVSGRGDGELAGIQIGNLNVGGPILQISGTTPVDVFNITGGAFQSVVNSTAGEFVNITAGSIGRLEAGNIGVPRKIAGVDPAHIAVRTNVFPFAQQRISINAGAIGYVHTNGALGNLNVTGNIDMIVANADNTGAAGEFHGIVAPVHAGGNIGLAGGVSIGEGISSSGNGSLAHSGIFASGRIGEVRGSGADIRGNIISEVGIDRIQLTNGGSIINSDIMIVAVTPGSPTALAASREWTPTLTPNAIDPVNLPDFDEIGAITISGNTSANNGGIMGAYIFAADIGDVNVTRGYGIINSTFSTTGDGRMKDFRVDGYGMRDVNIALGAAMGRMYVTGQGEFLLPTAYPENVRQWQMGNEFTRQASRFDNAARFEPNATTDLGRYLFGWRLTPDYISSTQWIQTPWDDTENTLNAGIIAGTTVKASRTLDLVDAWQVRPSTRLGVYNFSDFDIGNSITEFRTISDVIDMEVTTGSITRMTIGRDLISPSITVAGIFSELRVGRDYVGDKGTLDYNIIKAIGGNGEISSINIARNIDGTIFAQRRIGTVRVGGRFLNGAKIVERTIVVAP